MKMARTLPAIFDESIRNKEYTLSVRKGDFFKNKKRPWIKYYIAIGHRIFEGLFKLSRVLL